MYKDNVTALNQWFDDEERSYDTVRNDDGEYCVGKMDVDDFCDYLRKHEPDLIGIPCMVGTSGIWFNRKNLDDVRYY